MICVLLLVLGQASQPNEWSTFPPAGGQPAQAAPKKEAPKKDAPKGSPPSEDAKNRYREASQKIGAKDYGGATGILNELATQYPQWAAVFTARCIAQAGLKYPQYAVEDCSYALGIDPSSASALWWLASSEEALGRKADAAQHYQRYADLRGDDVSPTYREQALKKAQELGGAAPAPKPAPSPAPAPAKADAKPAPAPAKTTAAAAKPDDNTPVTQPNAWNSMPSSSAEPAAACKTNADCGAGKTCGDRGDGKKACLGNGKNGAFCAVSKDCVFPGKCKHRNDGVNVCMGGGGAGAFCDEGADCNGGFWCKDRGDGVKVCATK